MASTKVGGAAFIKVNGVQYKLRGGMTCGIGNVSRESVIGADSYHGFKEIPTVSFVECDITDTDGVDINELEKLEGATVTVELSNGKVAVLRDAVQINKLELNVADGQYTVRFEGPRGEWIS